MAADDARLLIFAKAPVAGLAKTRLIPALGAEGAARLAARLIEETVACTAGLCPTTLCCAPDPAHPLFAEMARRHDLALAPQREGDLGERMAAALERALTECGRAVVIGTDAPTLDRPYLREAFAALAEGADAVIGPAEDGGYVLIGLNRPRPELFRGIPWGGPAVLTRTRERLEAAGLRWRELATLPDIDRPEDLALLPPHPFI